MTIKNSKCTMRHDVESFLVGFDDHRSWTDPNSGIRWEVGVRWSIAELRVVVCVMCPKCGCALKSQKSGFEPVSDTHFWQLDHLHAGCVACHRLVRMNVPEEIAGFVRLWHGQIREEYSKKGATSW